MDINIIRNIFILKSVYMLLMGLLINFLEPFVPTLIKRGFLYGKFGVSDILTTKIEVPKRWFRHFYIFCAPLLTITLCSMFYTYVYNANIPEIVFTSLDILLGTSRKPLISAEDAILALFIFNIHCWKRIYETCYINVFSNQKMYIMIYLVGYTHYLGTILSILGESAGFVRGFYVNLNLYKITVMKLICAFICLWSSYMQLKSNIILANLRKNTHGDVVSYEYKIPSEGLFKYISSPLQFFEIIIYLMLSIILWQSSTYHCITLWVVINQVECALLSYQWYRNTFKNYPKERKIIIPYIW